MPRKLLIIAMTFASVCLAATPLALAGDQDSSASEKKETKTTPVLTGRNGVPGGMVVVKDPVTGDLRAPTAQEAAALREASPAARRAPRGPQEFASPVGGVGMVLDDSTVMYTVAKRGADGKVTLSEVTGGTNAKGVDKNAK